MQEINVTESKSIQGGMAGIVIGGILALAVIGLSPVWSGAADNAKKGS